MSAKCAVCAAQAVNQCAGCKEVRYCTTDCQKKHWGTHKVICKATVEAGKKNFVKEILEAGDGKTFPKAGDHLTMSYEGSLVNGTQFDSGDSFDFTIGVGSVIKGWDEGVMTMSLGEKARLVISPKYGYGARGAGGAIPGNATLVFVVQLKKIN